MRLNLQRINLNQWGKRMADREKILRYYRGTEGAEIAARLLDIAELVSKNRKYKVSEFLDPYGYTIAETIAASYDNIEINSSGGYYGAERQRVSFKHKDFLGNEDFAIKVIKATWNDKYYHISHRDILGSLIGLGIERNALGDLLVKSDHCKILLDSTIYEYVMQNFIQIGAASISVEECDLSEIEPKEERCKEIRATVASLRLDSVAAAGFSSSRSKIVADIATEKVKLNWQSIKGASQTIKVGDIISMRGRGRVEVEEIRGQTKKGRISIVLKRYI